MLQSSVAMTTDRLFSATDLFSSAIHNHACLHLLYNCKNQGKSLSALSVPPQFKGMSTHPRHPALPVHAKIERC